MWECIIYTMCYARIGDKITLINTWVKRESCKVECMWVRMSNEHTYRQPPNFIIYINTTLLVLTDHDTRRRLCMFLSSFIALHFSFAQHNGASVFSKKKNFLSILNYILLYSVISHHCCWRRVDKIKKTNDNFGYLNYCLKTWQINIKKTIDVYYYLYSKKISIQCVAPWTDIKNNPSLDYSTLKLLKYF